MDFFLLAFSSCFARTIHVSCAAPPPPLPSALHHAAPVQKFPARRCVQLVLLFIFCLGDTDIFSLSHTLPQFFSASNASLFSLGIF
jgi:hypothetical protein